MNIDQTLLHRYLSGDASEEEKKQVMDWIGEDKTHEQELKSLSLIYEAVVWNREKSVGEKKIHATKKFFSYTYAICKIAAVFLLGFFIHNLIVPTQNKEDSAKNRMLTFYAPAGQHAELTLEDGTTVWLNANSKIIYPATFKKNVRNVTLAGEAYFKVTHNERKPFIVNMGNYKVRVLGTEFNVFAYDKKKYKIDLLKGSVNVITPQNSFVKLIMILKTAIY